MSAATAPHRVSGLAAKMTVLAMGLGYSVSYADPIILSANISEVRAGLDMSGSSASFVASLATLSLAAAVLGAGALGDVYGKKRLFVIGLFLTIGFDLLAAAAPSSVILMVARAGVGVGFALVLGLSLAIINDVFEPGERAAAIALYLGASFALSAAQPAVGSLLAEQFGWRAGFLVAPVVAVLTFVITARYVPETPRAARKLDVLGLLLIAVALLSLVYGISNLERGLQPSATIPIALGVAAGIGFVYRELTTSTPALDLRIFRSRDFNAAVTAGATYNFLTGGSTILFAYYIVAVRGESPALLGLLLIPATLLQAFAATGSGRAAQRFGDRAVLVAGLLILIAGLLVLVVLDEDTPMFVLFVAVALNAVGGAVVQTPQSTIMMSSAPDDLGGAVAASKPATGQAAYSLGPTLFALIGTTLFVHDAVPKLTGTGITESEAREALRVAHGGTPGATSGANVLDPQKAHEVVSAATHSMVDAIHTLSLIMVSVPIAAIALALILLRPKSKQSERS